MFVKEHPEWPGTTPREDLVFLGYWRRNRERRKWLKAFPHPSEFVDLSWDQQERAAVAAYLEDQSHEILYSWPGSSTCRICAKRPIFRMTVGTEDRSVDFTDGKYAWPGGLGH